MLTVVIFPKYIIILPAKGELPEWSNGAVSKTVDRFMWSEGSNPSLSAVISAGTGLKRLVSAVFYFSCMCRFPKANKPIAKYMTVKIRMANISGSISLNSMLSIITFFNALMAWVGDMNP